MKLLAVELADIGDLIVATPALSALRETYPDAQIDVLTTPHAAPILNGTNLANAVLLFDKAAFDRASSLLRPANLRAAIRLAIRLRRGGYDAVLIFHHLTTRFGALKYAALALASGAPRRLGLDNGKGWFLTDRVPDLGFGVEHQVRYWLNVAALLGAKSADERLHIGISEADRAWVESHLPSHHPNRRLVAIHPGSGGYSLARRWEAEKFAALADRLIERDNAQIVLVGGMNDDVAAVRSAMHHSDKSIDLSGQTTLNQLAAILARCDQFFGADSGVIHIAAAAGTRVMALFGPSNHAAWSPWSASAQVVRTGVRCSPCSYVFDTVGLREGCAARTCMRTLTVEAVLAAVPDLRPIASPTETHEDRHGVGDPTRSPVLRVLGLPVHVITFDGLLDQIGEWVAGTTTRQICTINPEFIMAAQKDIHFYNILSRADLCVPDGIGLLWAARRLGVRLPERVTGSDGVPLIAARAAREGWKVFFLGAAPGVAAEAARRLIARFPALNVVGTVAGSPDPMEEDALIDQINASGADVLFVAYGAPNQDKWIARNLPRLRPCVAMGVGGALDFVAGVTQRAPLWMQHAGIEMAAPPDSAALALATDAASASICDCGAVARPASARAFRGSSKNLARNFSVEQPRQSEEIRTGQLVADVPRPPSILDMIREPQATEDLGISPSIVSDLVLRLIRQEGELTVRRIAEILCLSLKLLDNVLLKMKQDHLVEVPRAGNLGSTSFSYRLTEEGSVRARDSFERSQYIGPTPVPIEAYNAAIMMQTRARRHISPEVVQEAIAHLILPDGFHRRIGPAINAGSSLFLYGPPGNGKTTVAEAIAGILAGTDPIWLPYAVTTGGQIVSVYDQLVHKPIELTKEDQETMGDIDRRWGLFKRPAVMVGGELTMEALDLRYDEVSKFYEEPLQMKANGGMFLIDDFGRQQMRPNDLLNRWIVPLESGFDFLRLRTGQTIQLPFRQLIVFSTNLDPNDLMDAAFLRRIQMKVQIESPDEQLFFKIFIGACQRMGIQPDKDSYVHLIQEWYRKPRRTLQAVHPRDLLKIVRSLCEYENKPVRLTPQLIDDACKSYFV